jgi:ribulose-phosphate 3-epimerase
MNKRHEIIPAILPLDFAELEEKIGLVKDAVKTVQIDVCDGQFTPQPSWPYRKHDDSFEKIVHEDQGLPGWDKLNFEIDLMANKPEDRVEAWVSAGATRIILHVESKGDVGKAIAMLKGRVEVGLALNIDTPISEIGNPKLGIVEGSVQFIQLMGIDHIGFQGQEFDAKVIDKIKEIKKMCPDYPVSIDGGVSLENGKKLIEAGADRLVIGSAIFESDNFLDAIANFKALGR